MATTTPNLRRRQARLRAINRTAAPPSWWGRRRWPTVAQATGVVVVLGLLWRTLRYALGFPLWGDEAFVAVTLLERDCAELSRPPEFYQIVPPGFLWGEWLVSRWLGAGEWALRLIPYLAGVASLVWFRRFCRGVASGRTALLAVAVLAASSYPVRHSTEIKPYAVDLLVSLALTAIGWAVHRRPESVRRWLALIATAVAGVWCSYPAVFPAGAAALVLGFRVVRARSMRGGAWWAVYGGSLVVSWAVMYVCFAGPQARAAAFLTELKTWRDAFPPISEPWRIPWWLVWVHTGMMLAFPHGGPDYGSTATALFVIAGGVRMARRKSRRALLWLLLGPLPLALVAAALRRYPYGTSTRVMLYMAPAFCLLAAEGLMAALQLRHWTRYVPIALAGLLMIIPVVGAACDLARPYAGLDNVVQRHMARWVASYAGPHDQYVVFNSVTPPPLIPDLMITRWIQRVAVLRYYLPLYATVPVRWEPDPATLALGAGERLWLVVQRHGDHPFFSDERLAAYRASLEARLGRPREIDPLFLPNEERWSISVFPAAALTSAPAPGPAAPGTTSSSRGAR
jgi:Dolichyl-phosphate-mannose-protein mannosyltransferase